MRPIHVYADRERVDRCGSCQASIEWWQSVESSRWIPFDRPVVQQGEGVPVNSRPTMYLQRPASTSISKRAHSRTPGADDRPAGDTIDTAPARDHDETSTPAIAGATPMTACC